jgi:formylglycine-generating enzyme required for sulfatase activity
MGESGRQYFVATDLLKLRGARRSAVIDRIADHITGMIEQLRDPPPLPGVSAVAESSMGREPEPTGGDPGPVTDSSAPRTGSTGGDGHLPDFALFSDAPFAPELVVIPAGEFLMGSTDSFGVERPDYHVTIGQRFAIGRYPVTFVEYDRFCEAMRREKPEDQGCGWGRQPVINVSWRDAQDYLAWLSQETGRAYRLPSEAEWEYACRAGTTSRYSFGDTITPDNANCDSPLGRTSEVGAYPANSWGLHDMHGNVWKWVEDDWHDHYQGAPTDGSAWKDADSVGSVLRGGSWDFDSRNCRSAYRESTSPVLRLGYFGFRVARTLS